MYKELIKEVAFGYSAQKSDFIGKVYGCERECTAHIYIWDEPLNYIDVFSRMQIEKLILAYEPTMLVVEHDVRFQEKIATEIISV